MGITSRNSPTEILINNFGFEMNFRCVLTRTATHKTLELVELAPGVDIQKDILDQMEFEPIISPGSSFPHTRSSTHFAATHVILLPRMMERFSRFACC